MGLLDALGGGGSGNAKVTTKPPGFQIPYIKSVLGEAQNLYNQPGPQYFPGETVAGLNPNIQGSLNYLSGAAAPAQAQTAGASQQALGTAYASANPLMNPFFAQTAQAIIDPATQQMMRSILPQIDSGAVLAGQVGSSRQGVAQGNAINDYSRNILNALAQFGTSAYGQGLDTLSRGLAVAPQIQGMQAVPGQTLGAAGDYQRAYEQQLIDAAQQRYNYEQQLPYEKLNYYAGLVGNPLGSTTTNNPGSGQSGLQGALGGAATGAALGSYFPGVGTAAGGVLGGLLGFFGS